MNTLIKINNYKKQYEHTLIEYPSLSIKEGVTYLVGPNGCGKSTLLKSIASLIKYEGVISHNKTTAYLPEEHYFPVDNTMIDFLNCHHHYYQYSYDKMMSLIFTFHLEGKLTEDLTALSKGMKQKVNLITTLTRDVDLYLLDEPFSGLDIESKQTLKEYIKKSGKNFLITSHQNDVTAAERVINL